MAWVLTKGMTNLRNQINEVGPDRDKASDGTIGDTSHQASKSSHNPDLTGSPEWADGDSKDEVRAIDIDNSGPWLPGVTAEKIVQHLVEKGRSGNLETQIRYIIYNRRIWRASTGWATETYNGPSPHTEHIHFTGAFTQAADENTTYNYGLESLVTEMAEVDLTPGAINAVKTAVWGSVLGASGPTAGQDLESLELLPGRLADFLAAVNASIAASTAAVQAAISSENVDTEALAAALLPGLSSSVGSQVTSALQPLIEAGALTPAEVTAAVQSGVRNVLGSLDN